jgi:hypothetical protein
VRQSSSVSIAVSDETLPFSPKATQSGFFESLPEPLTVTSSAGALAVVMAPPAPKLQTQSSAAQAKNPDASPSIPKGPHPGYVQISQQYVFEMSIRRQMAQIGTHPSLDMPLCINGVQLIDNVREHLQL